MNDSLILHATFRRKWTEIGKELAGIIGGGLAIGGFVFVLFGAIEPPAAGLAFEGGSPGVTIQRDLSPTVLNRRISTVDKFAFDQLRDQG